MEFLYREIALSFLMKVFDSIRFELLISKNMKGLEKVRASIIIPTYNRSKLLDYTLQSISKQTIDLETVEIVVVDDGSTDDTLQIVKKYQKYLILKYYFQEDKGYRVASARNIGILNSESDVLIFIDCGVLLGSSCIKAHINFHESNPGMVAGLGYVYGWDQFEKDQASLVSLINLNDIDSSISNFRYLSRFLDMREDQYTLTNDQLNDLPAPWSFFITCNISIKRSSLVLTGLFDEKFDGHWGVEDLELGYRFHKQGGLLFVIRTADSIHYPHDADMSHKFRDEVSNKIYFHRKFPCLETELFLSSTFLELNNAISKASVQYLK
jgi:glycosyltransferase involved in cell wall biosynthesis